MANSWLSAISWPSTIHQLVMGWLSIYWLAMVLAMVLDMDGTIYGLAMGWLSAHLLLIQWHLYLSIELYFISINKYVYNRTAILTLVCSEPAYHCNVWAGVKGHYTCMFAAVFEFPILIEWEPFFGNRHFVLCVWDNRQYQNLETMGITITYHNPCPCPKLRNSYQQLLSYGSGQTYTWPTIRFPTGDQYQWWIKN